MWQAEGLRVPPEHASDEAKPAAAELLISWREISPALALRAAECEGSHRAAVDEAMRFARDNDLLGDVRVRDRLERMHRKVKMCRLLTFKAAWLADHQMPNIVEASMCKALAPQVGMEAASLGMELLGLVGGRGDHLIEKLYRDMKAMDIVEGTGQIQRVVMARQLVGFPN